MCGKVGHLARQCPNPSSFHNVNGVIEAFKLNGMSAQFLSTSDRVQAYDQAAAKFGNYPWCHTPHTLMLRGMGVHLHSLTNWHQHSIPEGV